MKNTLAFASIFSSVLFFNSTFAQEPLAHHTAIENAVPAQQQIASNDTYTHSFQAVVFPRISGNVSVHVQKSKHETIRVTIYNAEGQIVMQDKLGNRSLITKEYILKGLPSGTYSFEIAGSGNVYKKEIILN